MEVGEHGEGHLGKESYILLIGESGWRPKAQHQLNSSSVCSGLLFGRVLKMRSSLWSRVRLHEVNVTKSGNRSGP